MPIWLGEPTRTPQDGHARRNRGYNAKIWFDTRSPLLAGVIVMMANGIERYVSFLYEKLPGNYYLFCYAIKHDTSHCLTRLEIQETGTLLVQATLTKGQMIH